MQINLLYIIIYYILYLYIYTYILKSDIYNFSYNKNKHEIYLAYAVLIISDLLKWIIIISE
jgi:hypothetical protein